MSRVAFLKHIKSLNEGKNMFTSLLLGVSLFILLLLLDSYNRRHLHDLESRTRDLERKLAELQDDMTELRSERERREIVLRKEIGKTREEIVNSGKEFEAYQKRVEKEREVDRNVDMEEKLCLIRGLKEIAGEKGIEVESLGESEKLVGLGIHLDDISSDEESSPSPNNSEDEAQTGRIKAQGDEVWERFEQTFIRNNGERGEEEGASPDEKENADDRHDPSSEILVDIHEKVSLSLEEGIPGTPETKGERPFPLSSTPQREFPLVNRGRSEVQFFTDPGVQAQIDHVFELE